jgi:hypothetical protein
MSASDRPGGAAAVRAGAGAVVEPFWPCSGTGWGRSVSSSGRRRSAGLAAFMPGPARLPGPIAASQSRLPSCAIGVVDLPACGLGYAAIVAARWTELFTAMVTTIGVLSHPATSGC